MSTMIASVLLAAPQPGDYDPSTGKGPEWGKAAPIGLLVILLLGIALFFLLRSFTRQLKKVPASFDPPDQAPDQAGSGRVATTATLAAGAARVSAPPDDGPPSPGPGRPAGADDSPG